MNNKRRNRKSTRGVRDGIVNRLFAQTKLPAHVSEEQDWYLDTPDIRLTRVFTIVLILHVVAVGGILAFKMIEKASSPGAVATVSTPEATQAERREAPTATQTDISTASAAVQAPKPAPEAKTQPKPQETVGRVTTDSTPGVMEYQVQDGDTIVGIAREMKVSVADLKKENVINGDNELYPGRWLRVTKAKPVESKAEVAAEIAATQAAIAKPKPKTEAAAAVRKPAAVKTPAPAASAPSHYVVKKGDTAYGIARKFGIKHTTLLSANGISRPESMQIGQKLTIPGR